MIAMIGGFTTAAEVVDLVGHCRQYRMVVDLSSGDVVTMECLNKGVVINVIAIVIFITSA